MAVEFTTAHTRTSEYLFPPEAIKIPSDLNGRHDLPDIADLIQSIIQVGQLQPILVRNDGGTPVLVAGFSRWRAISEINQKKLLDTPIQVRCVYKKSNEQSGFLANIHENCQRNPLSDLDKAHAMVRLEQWGKSEEEIAGHFRCEPKDVRRLTKLVELSPEAEKALREGRLKTPAALAIAKLSADQQKQALKAKLNGKPRQSSQDTSQDAQPSKKYGLPDLRRDLSQIREKSDYFGKSAASWNWTAAQQKAVDQFCEALFLRVESGILP